jgi:alpha-glucosidase
MRRSTAVLFLAAAAVSVSAIQVDPSVLDACPGYSVTNVETRRDGLTADLVLLPNPCNVFGDDIQKLSLSVIYETGMSDRLILDIRNYYSSPQETESI